MPVIDRPPTPEEISRSVWTNMGALLVSATIFEGLALWALWQWFIVPLGVPSISYLHAMGLSLIAMVLRSTPRDHLREYQLQETFSPRQLTVFLVRDMVSSVGLSLIIIGAGWLLSWGVR